MQNSEHVSTNPENMSKTVAIIGAGLIGCGWAIVFARAGWGVSLYDPHQQARIAAQDLRVPSAARGGPPWKNAVSLTKTPGRGGIQENREFVDQNSGPRPGI